MSMDIDQLTEDELIELNHRIVARLRFLESLHTQHEMMQFNPGEQVSFQAPGRGRLVGKLIKYNKKTVTIITESGQRWNVSPLFLSKVKDVDVNSDSSAKVVTLPGRK